MSDILLVEGALIKNYGNAPGSKEIVLTMDGISDSQVATLLAGMSMSISFRVTPMEAKVYQVTLDGMTKSYEVLPPPFDPWAYDFNGNGVIETNELMAAANDYYAGIITKEQFEQVRALWEQG